MVQENIKTIIQNAMQSYRIAENEINRPNEDAVTLCACYSTRDSINKFLHSFLLTKSDLIPLDKIDDLLNQCSKIDPKFAAIDLSCFNCRKADDTHISSYCLSADKVNECFNQAKAVKQIVLDKLNLSEKDFD